MRLSSRSLALALALISLGIYLPMLRADFVWDARPAILTSPYLHDASHFADILSLRVMSRDVLDNNRPVFLLSALLDWTLWGIHPFGFHLTNIVLHALVVVLLFAWLRRLLPGDGPGIPFFAALLFAVHPINCEAVAEVSYRKDLIAAACILGALHLAALFQPRLSWKNVTLGGLCVLLLFLAVGAKENGAAGPPALVCYWLWFRRGEPRRGWLALLGVATLVVAAFLLARFTLPPRHSLIFTERPAQLGGSLLDTLLIQTRIWAFYARQVVLPLALCADYGAYNLRHFGLDVSIVVLLVVIGAQVLFSRVNRVSRLGAAFFWLALLPASNLVPLYRVLADRFLYLPMCGVAMMLAGMCSAAKFNRRMPAFAATAATVCLAACTFQREKVWQNEEALWTDTAQKNPSSYPAAANLASALLEKHDAAASVESADRAIEIIHGQRPDPYAIKALALEQLGRPSEADAAYKKALELDARYRDPRSLVTALVWEEKDVPSLEALARRNR